ncbi:hypothetical protein MRX96_001809 [Rhipicephalus microplus]
MKAFVFLAICGAAYTSSDSLCLLPKEPGPCVAYVPRYFYNNEAKKCQLFIYGGCQGNANNFDNFTECTLTCKPKLPVGIATLDSEPATLEPICRWKLTRCATRPSTLVPALAFSLDITSTTRPTLAKSSSTEDARPTATTSAPWKNAGTHAGHPWTSILWRPMDAFEVPFWPFAPPEECAYSVEAGPCQAYMPRFFYNTLTKTCEQFVYGGCGGNANNFPTFDACEKKCKKVSGVVPRA